MLHAALLSSPDARLMYFMPTTRGARCERHEPITLWRECRAETSQVLRSPLQRCRRIKPIQPPCAEENASIRKWNLELYPHHVQVSKVAIAVGNYFPLVFVWQTNKCFAIRRIGTHLSNMCYGPSPCAVLVEKICIGVILSIFFVDGKCTPVGILKVPGKNIHAVSRTVSSGRRRSNGRAHGKCENNRKHPINEPIDS